MPIGEVQLRHLSIGGVDLSSYVERATLVQQQRVATYFQSGDVRRKKTGLQTDTVTASLTQDRDAGAVDATIQAAFDSSDSTDIVVRPSTAAVGPTNPQWAGKMILSQYAPIAGDQGQIERVNLQLVSDGALTRTVA